MNAGRRSALLSATLAFGGCDSWEEDSRYSYPVFSDDGAGIAAVYMTFEAQDTTTHTRTRNHETQVLMKEDTSSTVPTAITSLMLGQVRDLFFMRDEEYIILGRHNDEVERSDGSSERTIWYDRVDLDGTVTNIAGGSTYLSMLSCDGGSSSSSTAGPLKVIPSPDGTVLALFESTSSCSERSMQVTFLDAADLSVLDGPHTVPDVEPTWSGGTPWWATVDLAWTAENGFAAGFWGASAPVDHLSATTIEVGGTVTEAVIIAMDCFYPATTSSSTNADGDGVEINERTGTLNTSATSYVGAYGCSE
ncbi:MAG TPA: hypothetical protein DFR83_15785 [Deltaproteobacteria bacterium]|nr:hypothetical protein [Deltaproteobacteria bacterium]